MKETSNYKYNVLAGGIGRVIDVSNPNTSGASGWEYNSNTQTITIYSPSDYTLTGYTSQNTVIVEPKSPSDIPFNIILQNVSIYASSKYRPAFSVKGTGLCRLLLYEHSSFQSGYSTAGIYVAPESSLEIDELLPDRDYELSVRGGYNAACIGANEDGSYGNITIKDITLYLNPPEGGTGIGCADANSSTANGKIRITGGKTRIDSYSNIYYFVGISCDNLEISGGVLEIDISNNCGDAILIRSGARCNKQIVITGTAEVYANGGANNGIGIGTIDSTDSRFTQSIIIDGGLVYAHGGNHSVGIGTSGDGVLHKLEIRSGTVSAYGGKGAPGIGSFEASSRSSNPSGILEINLSDKAHIFAKGGASSFYDIADYRTETNFYSTLIYSGLYSGFYSGEIAGSYLGTMSGWFQGEVNDNGKQRVSCTIDGNYAGEATGRYSGLFSGKFMGYIKRNS